MPAPPTPTSRPAPSSTTSAAPAPTGTWRTIPPAPGQAHAATVWTGAELVAWSGTGPDGHPVSGGVAYRPGHDSWRELPHGPLSPRTGHRSVWTGSEVVVWGGNAPGADEPFADGAAYDPGTDTWRRLSPSPIPGRLYHHMVWIGPEVIVWGGSTRCCPIDSVIHDPAAAAYDPRTDRWRRLPDVPRPWSGDGGPAAVDQADDAMVIWRAGHLARLDPASGAWQDLGSPPESPSDCQARTSYGPLAAGAVVGSRLFAWSGPCSLEFSWTFDLHAGEWKASSAPVTGLRSIHAAGDRLFGITRPQSGDPTTWSLVELDTRHDTWGPASRVPAPPSYPAVTWTGTELLLWGEHADGRRGGLAYRP